MVKKQEAAGAAARTSIALQRAQGESSSTSAMWSRCCTTCATGGGGGLEREEKVVFRVRSAVYMRNECCNACCWLPAVCRNRTQLTRAVWPMSVVCMAHACTCGSLAQLPVWRMQQGSDGA